MKRYEVRFANVQADSASEAVKAVLREDAITDYVHPFAFITDMDDPSGGEIIVSLRYDRSVS